MANINPLNPFRIICICGSTDVMLMLSLFNNGKPRAQGKCRLCGRRNDLNHNLSNDEFFMPFGKYKGKTVKEIVSVDEQYATWAARNLSDQIKSRFQDELSGK